MASHGVQWKILKGGNVWRWTSTYEGKFEKCDISIENGIIVDVIPREDDGTVSQNYKNVVDMSNQYILPGLTDSHIHVDFASSISSFALLYGKTVNQIIESLKSTSPQTNGWILGIGWEFKNFEPKIKMHCKSIAVSFGINREVLDAEFPNTPVFLYSACCHAGIINTCGLHRCHLIPKSQTEQQEIVSKLHPYIARGLVDLCSLGSLTGLFFDTAVFQLICPYFFPGDRILAQLKKLSGMGLTGVQSCDMRCSRAYKHLSSILPLRIFHTPWLEDVCAAAIEFDVRLGFTATSNPLYSTQNSLDSEEWDQPIRNILARLKHERDAGGELRQALYCHLNVCHNPKVHDRLITNRIKLFADGTIGSQTAAMNLEYQVHKSELKSLEGSSCSPHSCSLRHYSEDSTSRGALCWNEQELSLRFRLIKELDLRAEVHAIGDRACEKVLSCLKLVGLKQPNVLTHCCILSAKAISDMKEQRIIANIQPSFVSMDSQAAKKLLSPNALRYAFIWKTLMRENDIICAGGSDAPICDPDPLLGIYDAMFRYNNTSRKRHKPLNELETICDLHPNECLTFPEALFLYTLGASSASSTMSDLRQDQSWLKEKGSACSESSDDLKLGAIERGFTADFTVVDRDISMNCSETLLSANVMATWVAGELYFSKTSL